MRSAGQRGSGRVDSARRSIAATAVDELATLADLMADIAREIGAPIEQDLRAAKRRIDVTYAESYSGRAIPALKPVAALLIDPTEIPEFRGWHHGSHNRRVMT